MKFEQALAANGIQWSAHKADNEHTLILAVHPSGEASGIEVPNKGFDVWKFRATIKSLLRELGV
jgi:hypothetical protein